MHRRCLSGILLAAPFHASVEGINVFLREPGRRGEVQRLRCADTLRLDRHIDLRPPQEFRHGFGAGDGELLVIIITATTIGMADERDAGGSLLLDRAGEFARRQFALRRQTRRPVIESDGHRHHARHDPAHPWRIEPAERAIPG